VLAGGRHAEEADTLWKDLTRSAELSLDPAVNLRRDRGYSVTGLPTSDSVSQNA